MKGRARFVLVVALAVFSLAFSVWPDNARWSWIEPSFGVSTYDNLVVDGVDDEMPAAKARIRVGDRIERVGLSLGAVETLFGDRFPRLGERIDLRVERDGKVRAVTLVARNTAPPPLSWRVPMYAGKCIAVLFICIGAIIVLVRPQPLTWAFFVFCLGVHPHMVTVWQDASPTFEFVSELVLAFLQEIGTVALLVFVARFPDDRANGRYRIIEWAALPALFLLFGLSVWNEANYLTPISTAQVAEQIRHIILAAIFSLAFATLLVKLKNADEAQRSPILWMTIGVGVGGFAGHMLVGEYQNWSYWNNALPTAPDWLEYVRNDSQVFIPICAMYAILRHQALQLGFVANRIMLYGLLVAVGAIVFVTLDVAISRHLASTRVAIGIALALALGAGLAIQWYRSRLIRWIDRIFFRQRHAAALTLDRLRATAGRGERVESDRIAAEIAQGLGLASVALFRRSADGGFIREAAVGWPSGTAWHLLPKDPIARSLEADERQVVLDMNVSPDVPMPSADARPSIALPLRSGGRVQGAVLIGTRKPGEKLDRDEARGIVEVFARSALA